MIFDRIFLENPAGGGWIGALMPSTSITVQGRQISYDSSGNIYVAANSALAKISSLGVLQWARYMDSCARSGVADSSGNFYIGGRGTNASNGQAAMFIGKFDTSGTIQWKRIFQMASGPDGYAEDMTINSAGNIIACGYTVNAGYYQYTTVMYNSSGALQNAQTIGTTTTTAVGSSVTSDTNYIYTNGRFLNSTTSTQSVSLFRYSTSLGFPDSQWQYADSNIDNYGGSIAADGAGNIYFGAATFAPSGWQPPVLYKLNSSFSEVWSRRWGSNASSFQLGSIAGITFDPSGNVYVVGTTNDSSGRRVYLISKITAAGSVQWTNLLGDTNRDIYGYDIRHNGNGSLLVTGTFYDGTREGALVAVLPDTGGGTGTYSLLGRTITYTAAAPNIGSGTLSPYSVYLGSSFSGNNGTNVSETDSAFSGAFTKVDI